jgi:hypothetical protein
MIGDPVEDDLRCGLEASLSHGKRGHVVTHGATLRGKSRLWYIFGMWRISSSLLWAG